MGRRRLVLVGSVIAVLFLVNYPDSEDIDIFSSSKERWAAEIFSSQSKRDRCYCFRERNCIHIQRWVAARELYRARCEVKRIGNCFTGPFSSSCPEFCPKTCEVALYWYDYDRDEDIDLADWAIYSRVSLPKIVRAYVVPAM